MAKAPGAPLVWPEAAAGWGARLTFGYITPLLRLGATGGDMLVGDPIPIMVRRTDASHKASTAAEARGMLGP